jgi:hypothetical protein
MVYLRNVCVSTLHKGDIDDDYDDNNNNNNNNIVVSYVLGIDNYTFEVMRLQCSYNLWYM